MIRTLGNIALAVAALGCMAFVVAYAWLADWRSSALGKNVMAFMAALGAMLTLAILRNFTPWIDDHVDGFRLGAFVIVALIVWHRVFLLIKAQMTRDRETPGYGEASMHTDHGGNPT